MFIQHLGRQTQFRKPCFRQLPDQLLVFLGVMCPHHVLDKADDSLGWVQGVHGSLGNVGNFRAEDALTDIIRLHAGDISAVDDDIAAHIVQRREIVAHHRKRQRGFSAAGLARDAQGLAFLDFEGDAVHGVNILVEAGHIFGFEVSDLQHYFTHCVVLLSLSRWD